MNKSLFFKSGLLLAGLLVVGYVFFGYSQDKDNRENDLKPINLVAEISPQPEVDFEENDKCRQMATQINSLSPPPKTRDSELPQSKEEQIRWLESDMDDGRVLKTVLEERLDSSNVRVISAYDSLSGDEYQAIEISCGEWPVGGAVLYLVNRTQNKVLAVEANEYIWIKSFSDIDGNGINDLVFQDVTGGNCWGCSSMRILQVSPQRVEEVKIPKGFVMSDIAKRADALVDGYVVYANDIRWEVSLNLPHCCGPWSHWYFYVNGDKVADMSPLYKQEYKELVQLSDEDKNYNIGTIVSNLLLREAMDERDEGWQEFTKDWEQADVSEMADVDNYADKVFSEFERQYRQQKMFTPFEIDDDGGIKSRL